MELRDRFRGGVQELSAGYYAVCGLGGMLSSGTAHLAITPLDVLEVNMQVNPLRYRSIASGLTTLWKEEGPSSLWRGWSGKLFGYGIQGGVRFGLYEYFKKLYSDVLVDRNRTSIFFMSSACAQGFADVALCPFEAVRLQTQPNFAKGLADGSKNFTDLKDLLGKNPETWLRFHTIKSKRLVSVVSCILLLQVL